MESETYKGVKRSIMKKKYYYLPFNFSSDIKQLDLVANEKFEVIEIINTVIIFKGIALKTKREMPISVFKCFAIKCE